MFSLLIFCFFAGNFIKGGLMTLLADVLFRSGITVAAFGFVVILFAIVVELWGIK
jgi:hypothetical protein